jgi:pimeloyl-ACP methyl ester carboxylesterase
MVIEKKWRSGEVPTVSKYKVQFDDAALLDLRERLLRARWPDDVAGGEWRYGTSVDYLKDLIEYWIDEYDWRRQERLLNEFDHYRALSCGVNLHFIHSRGKSGRPTPLLLLHGWPSSVWEFRKILPMLTDPRRFGAPDTNDFTVVVPSLPGYGFSGQPGARYGIERIADILSDLMTDQLGYDRFGIVGGDWGAYIGARLAHTRPRNVLGLHLNMLPKGEVASWRANPTDDQRAYLAALDTWKQQEGGYSAIQATRPQTVAFGLTDSPVGLAAWIIEKFHAWSDCAGDIESRFSKDDLLTTVMIYWLTGTIGSSFWPYVSRHQGEWSVYDLAARGRRIETPTAFIDFPAENLHPPRSIGETIFNIRQWTTTTSGGHFPALEEPATLISSIRAFFRSL